MATPSIDKTEVRKDPYLRWMMRLGVPLGLIALASLWIGRSIGSSGLGLLFFITMPAALALGFAYNVRFLMLTIRQRKNDNEPR